MGKWARQEKRKKHFSHDKRTKEKRNDNSATNLAVKISTIFKQRATITLCYNPYRNSSKVRKHKLNDTEVKRKW